MWFVKEMCLSLNSLPLNGSMCEMSAMAFMKLFALVEPHSGGTHQCNETNLISLFTVIKRHNDTGSMRGKKRPYSGSQEECDL